jgi:hypothetical protein
MSQAFVYKWTQISTNKWYVGSRTAKNCYVGDEPVDYSLGRICRKASGVTLSSTEI